MNITEDLELAKVEPVPSCSTRSLAVRFEVVSDPEISVLNGLLAVMSTVGAELHHRQRQRVADWFQDRMRSDALFNAK